MTQISFYMQYQQAGAVTSKLIIKKQSQDSQRKYLMLKHVFLQQQKTNGKIFSDPVGEVKKLPGLTQLDWILPGLISSPLTLKWDHTALTSPHTHTLHAHRQTPQAECLCGQERLYSVLLTPSNSISGNVCLPNTHRQPANRERCVTRRTCSLSLSLALSLSLSNAVSLLLTLHKSPVISHCPGDSPLICSPAH